MTVGIKVATATFSKFFDVAFPQPTSLLGFYELVGSTPLANKAGGAALTLVGTPTIGLTGSVIANNSGYDTGIVRPAGDFTFLALVKGVVPGIGMVIMGEFDNSLASGSAGNTLTYKGGTAPQQGIGSFLGNGSDSTINQNVFVNKTDVDPAKWYLLALTRVGVAAKVYAFGSGRTPSVASGNVSSVETVTRSVLLGDYRGTTNGGFPGTAEMTSAGIWSRGLTQADLQTMYDYFTAKAPGIGYTLA